MFESHETFDWSSNLKRTLIVMYSRKVLKWHILVFKFCALWPPEDGSFLYNFYTIIFSILVNFAFPISQLVCVFYVDSIDAAVDHLVMTSTIIMAATKGLNVLAKKKTFVKLLHLMEKMDEEITVNEEESVFHPIFRDSDRVLLIFFINYVASWTCVGLQVIMSSAEDRLYSSTFLFPVEFLHHPAIYVGGILFQAIGNLFLVFIDMMVDTYGASLLHVLGGHLDVLGNHLRAFGGENPKLSNVEQKRKLVKLCERYILIIRYSKLLEEILSFALFAQFGVSGLVLCTCAYQLSVVSPINDPSKFIFCAVYSFAMITEIFVPSYFGSVLSIKSEHLTYNIFMSGWVSLSPSQKRMLHILAEQTILPIGIKAGGIFMLNLPTMLQILKTAYSLFALLKNVQE